MINSQIDRNPREDNFATQIQQETGWRALIIKVGFCAGCEYREELAAYGLDRTTQYKWAHGLNGVCTMEYAEVLGPLPADALPPLPADYLEEFDYADPALGAVAL